jgi:hypothetical protein
VDHILRQILNDALQDATTDYMALVLNGFLVFSPSSTCSIIDRTTGAMNRNKARQASELGFLSRGRYAIDKTAMTAKAMLGIRWFLRNHYNVCQRRINWTFLRTLTGAPRVICGAGGSGTDSAAGSVTGSALETHMYMTDFRPEVPVAMYLVLCFADR